jgi:hypothetical protein
MAPNLVFSFAAASSNTLGWEKFIPGSFGKCVRKQEREWSGEMGPQWRVGRDKDAGYGVRSDLFFFPVGDNWVPVKSNIKLLKGGGKASKEP